MYIAYLTEAAVAESFMIVIIVGKYKTSSYRYGRISEKITADRNFQGIENINVSNQRSYRIRKSGCRLWENADSTFGLKF